jgi:quercetin dioxygenase-like cupin family protein
MKRVSLSIALAVGGLIFLGTTEASAQEQTKRILWAAEDLKWKPTESRLAGAMTVTLRGDPSKGAYEEFVKYPAGFKARLHSHTYDQKVVVLKGAFTYQGKKYGPGSYLLIPAGDEHEGGGASDSETVIYQEQSGKFDMKFVEPPKEMK